MENRLFRIFIWHCLPLLLVSLLFGLSATGTIRAFLRNENERQAHKLLVQTVSYFKVVFNEMDSLNLMFSENPEMLARLERLMSKKELSLEDYKDTKLIRSFLSSPANAKPYIDSVYVYVENQEYRALSSNNGLIDVRNIPQLDYSREFPKKSKLIVEVQNVIKLVGGTKRSIIRLVRPFFNVATDTRGLIVIDLFTDVMTQDYINQFLGAGQYLSLKTGEGIELFTLPSKIPYSEDKMSSFTETLDKYGLSFTLGTRKKDLFAPSSTLMWITASLSLFALLIGLFLTIHTNKKERKFLGNVIEQLNSASFRHLENTQKEKEFNNIFDYLNYYVLKTFLQQDYLRYQNEAMEYRALQMQINPHFLYNTLDTIYWKGVALCHGENDLTSMITLLSKLFKYSLEYHGTYGVLLDQEIAATNYYLEIQAIRFKDRFRVQWEIDSNLKDIRVPCLCFQPILENAFNHRSIDDKMLEIRITIKKQDQDIVIDFENNGQPIGPEEIANLNDENIDSLVLQHNLGIANTRKRLILFANGKASLHVGNTPEGKILIRFTLPQIS